MTRDNALDGAIRLANRFDTTVFVCMFDFPEGADYFYTTSADRASFADDMWPIRPTAPEPIRGERLCIVRKPDGTYTANTGA